MYAKYTEFLRDLMNNPLTKPLLDKALSTYPLYTNDKKYDLIPTREELNQKILNHYKYREIGFETVGRFLDELEITMNEIMPYYNEMFKTIVTMAELPNPFDNVDVTETFEEERSGESSNNTNDTGSLSSETSGSSTSNISTSENDKNESHHKKVHSETPANSLDVAAKDIDSVNYADDVEWNSNEEDNNRSESTESNSTENQSQETSSSNIRTATGTTRDIVSHTFKKVGNQGVNTYAHDMNEFRTSIIDVVNDIINDNRLNELFMLVY